MIKKLAIAVIGLVIYLLTLLLTTPIANFYQWFLPTPFQVVGIEGTLPQGRIQQFRWSNGSLSDVRWQTHLGWLLLGQLRLDVSFQGGVNGSGELIMTPWGWRLEDVQMSTSLSSAIASLPVELPVALSGQLSVHITDFKPARKGCETLVGRLLISNTQIRSGLGSMQPSDMRGTLQCKHQLPQLSINHHGALFELNLLIKRQSLQWVLDGRFKPTPKMPKAYRQLLRQTSADNQGYHYIHLTL